MDTNAFAVPKPLSQLAAATHWQEILCNSFPENTKNRGDTKSLAKIVLTVACY